MIKDIEDLTKKLLARDRQNVSERLTGQITEPQFEESVEQIPERLYRCLEIVDSATANGALSGVPLRRLAELAANLRALDERLSSNESAQNWQDQITTLETRLWDARLLDVPTDLQELQTSINASREIVLALKEAAADAEASRTEIEEVSDKLAECNRKLKEIEDLQQTITDQGKAVSDTQQQSAKILGSMETAGQTAQTHADAANEAKSQAQKTQRDAAEALNTIQEAIEKVAQTNSSLGKHETDLADKAKQYETMRKRIEGLLPGATSTGLASAFDQQKSRFTWPKRMWIMTFYASIVALVALAYFGSGDLLASLEGKLDWATVGAYFARRIPLAAPIIWLAIYAGHHHKLAARLEEEYAYKEAISRALEGYKREMSEVKAHADSLPPLNKLCDNVLEALALAPGRIYDSKQDDVTPAKTLAEAARELTALVKEVKLTGQ